MPISILGDGSITGLTAGGLPDASVVDLDLATGISSSKLTGALPAISGALLTSLDAGNLTGTIADARFPAVLPAISGASLTNLPGGDNTPSFSVMLSASQNIGYASWVKINWNVELWDTNSAYDSSTYRFTVPTGEGGKYLFTSHAAVYNIGDGKDLNVSYFVNGSQVASTRARSYSSDASGQAFVTNACMITLSAGDYIETYILQNNGGTQSLYSNYSRFSGMKLIGV